MICCFYVRFKCNWVLCIFICLIRQTTRGTKSSPVENRQHSWGWLPFRAPGCPSFFAMALFVLHLTCVPRFVQAFSSGRVACPSGSFLLQVTETPAQSQPITSTTPVLRSRKYGVSLLVAGSSLFPCSACPPPHLVGP